MWREKERVDAMFELGSWSIPIYGHMTMDYTHIWSLSLMEGVTDEHVVRERVEAMFELGSWTGLGLVLGLGNRWVPHMPIYGYMKASCDHIWVYHIIT